MRAGAPNGLREDSHNPWRHRACSQVSPASHSLSWLHSPGLTTSAGREHTIAMLSRISPAWRYTPRSTLPWGHTLAGRPGS